MPGRSPSRPTTEAIAAVLTAFPLVVPTRDEWAPLAAAQLPTFLADHAVCEQQVAVYALSLAGHYPGDHELVEKAAALALEEVQHFRRVVRILHRRGYPTAGRRPNRWVQALRGRVVLGRADGARARAVEQGGPAALGRARRSAQLRALHAVAGGGRGCRGGAAAQRPRAGGAAAPGGLLRARRPGRTVGPAGRAAAGVARGRGAGATAGGRRADRARLIGGGARDGEGRCGEHAAPRSLAIDDRFAQVRGRVRRRRRGP